MTHEEPAKLATYRFEMGPIRPPSEAASLLIRVTRNCQWNRCLFCPVYKETVFSVRPVEHVMRDIDIIREYIDFLEYPTHNIVIGEPLAYDAALRWNSLGMKSVFLQDADALVIGAHNLVKILAHLKNKFPDIERITSYSRSSTINKMTIEDLVSLHEAGLNRIHVGLESGSDNVLKMVRKGASKAIHVRAGLRVKEAGIELSEYFMPGLGGRHLSKEHAIESADAITQINPDFIRLRPIAFPVRAPLYDMVSSGDFDRCNDIEIVQELHTFISNLEGISGYLVSDHILNLFADLKGQFPEDKKHLLSITQRFLDMDAEEQTLYRFGRRLGAFSSLNDLEDTSRKIRISEIMAENNVNQDNIDSMIDEMMQQFV
ncbi:MAG: radical SAM protein [Candidatus Thorarchaeota archaeon]